MVVWFCRWTGDDSDGGKRTNSYSDCAKAYIADDDCETFHYQSSTKRCTYFDDDRSDMRLSRASGYTAGYLKCTRWN